MEIDWIPVTKENIEIVKLLHISPLQAGMVETVMECFEEAKEISLWRPTAIELDGELVGFAMYGLWAEEGEGEGRVWLDRFFIDEQYQGMGYAKKILPPLIRKIQKEYGCDKIYLSVYEQNKIAVLLYQKFGFSFNGEVDVNGEKVMCANVSV